MSIMEPFGHRLVDGDRSPGAAVRRHRPAPRTAAALGSAASVAGLERFAMTAVEALGPTVAVLKPQSAFFESYGSAGIAVLERVITDAARRRCVGAAGCQARRHRLDDGRLRRRLPDRRLAAGGRCADGVAVPGVRIVAAGARLRLAEGRGLFVLALTRTRRAGRCSTPSPPTAAPSPSRSSTRPPRERGEAPNRLDRTGGRRHHRPDREPTCPGERAAAGAGARRAGRDRRRSEAGVRRNCARCCRPPAGRCWAPARPSTGLRTVATELAEQLRTALSG